jgi:hypothetical protein
MNLIKTVKTARISKMWMNPPNVPDVATATIHRASKIMKIVTSISFLYSPCSHGRPEAEAVRLKRAD